MLSAVCFYITLTIVVWSVFKDLCAFCAKWLYLDWTWPIIPMVACLVTKTNKLVTKLKKNCWATCEKTHLIGCLPAAACLRLKIEKETNGLGTCWHDVVDYELFQFSLSDFISTSFKEFSFLKRTCQFPLSKFGGEKNWQKRLSLSRSTTWFSLWLAPTPSSHQQPKIKWCPSEDRNT